MIDADESAVRTVCCGLAAATASMVIAASTSAVGRTRRHSGTAGRAATMEDTAGKRIS